MKSITFFLIIISTQIFQSSGFKDDQLRYSRVRNAYKQKGTLVDNLLKDKSITTPYIFLRIFKQEEVIEVWTREKSKEKYSLLKKYDFCSTSGELGPKRQSGDYQIPEGFYYIDRFNPSSNFYLSLGVNYPNASDRILGVKGSLGGDIFIHGDCVTIGCMPITDDKIMELYILAVEAKNNGQVKIPVHIFPTMLAGSTYETLNEEYSHNKSLIKFWTNLKPSYDYFESHKNLPKISVSTTGNYVIDKKG